VYLTVSGLTADTFTVKVIGGVKDTAGNLIAPNSQVAARALNWNAIDIGNIQHPSPRVPTPGDDPYRVGKSVMVSSDENPEVEVVGGGSNQWNPGDYVHYIYRTTPLSGNFDVTIAVSRFDRSVRQGGYSNAGLMLRVSPYLPGLENTVAGSKVPMVANTTYIEASGPVVVPFLSGEPTTAAVTATATPVSVGRPSLAELRGILMTCERRIPAVPSTRCQRLIPRGIFASSG
jgi:hypothetical protein